MYAPPDPPYEYARAVLSSVEQIIERLRGGNFFQALEFDCMILTKLCVLAALRSTLVGSTSIILLSLGTPRQIVLPFLTWLIAV